MTTHSAALVPVAIALLLVLPVAARTQPQTQPQTQPAGEADHDHAHPPTSTHPFDDVEKWASVFDSPDRAEWQKPEIIPGLLGLKEGMVVADIGAGTGYFESFFSKAVGPSGVVYAVDTEPKMVAHLKDRAKREATANVIPVLAASDDPKLPDRSVDVVFICDTYHHIGDRIAYMRKLGAALKPRGSVAVVDFHKRPLPVGPPPEHKLARETVVAEFVEAGWALASESDELPYQYLLVFRPAPEAP